MATWIVTYRDHTRNSEIVEADDVASMDATAGGSQREVLLLVTNGKVVFAAPGDAVLSLVQKSSES